MQRAFVNRLSGPDQTEARAEALAELRDLQREELLRPDGCLCCKRHMRNVICCTLTRCGLLCDGQCLQIHLRNCADCSSPEALAEIPADCRSAYLAALQCLPGMAHVPADRAEAAAIAEGESLTGQMLTPMASISRTAGQLETFSPLFRETAANPQLSLF